MPVLRVKPAIRLAVAVAVLAAAAPAVRAEPPKSVRVIQITRDNAERSAAAIAAAKSPFIGAPPRGKRVRSTPDWRNARAEAPGHDIDVAQQEGRLPARSAADASDRAVVRIVKPGKAGPQVETWLVPRGR
jgi:hypothetical protein